MVTTRTHSTREAAKALGISWVTLQRYVSSRKVSAPNLTRVGGVKVRLWTKRDIERVREQLPAVYYKGGDGRRKKRSRKR